MEKFKKKFAVSLTSFILAFILIMNMLPQLAFAEAYDPKTNRQDLEIRFWEDKQPDVGFYINASARYILETVKEPSVGATFGEWSVMDLLRGMYTGYDYINYIPNNYFEDYLKRVKEDVIRRKGNLHPAKSTEWSRLMLTLTSLGYDITDVAGYNFIEKLSKSHKFSYRQGINGPIWEIIGMNTGKYKFYEDPNNDDVNSFGKMINYILKQEITQKDGTVGGWALFGDFPDVDITGMALQALAPYYLNQERYEEVREKDSPTYEEFAKAVERGIYILSELQLENGGYESWGSTNSESIVQVIVALTALDIDPMANEVNLPHIGKTCSFITNGAEQDGAYTNNMVDALLTFWAKGSGSSPEVGGFKHVTTGYDGGSGSGTEVNAMATDQALYGLIAYARYKKGENSLYDMTDMKNGEYKNMKANSYTVSYNSDGKIEKDSYSPYAAIELPEGDSTDEKIFKNWNTKADGSGTSYEAGELLSMPEHDITLHAQYRDETTIKDIIPVDDAVVVLGTTEEEAKEKLPKTTKIIDSEDEEFEVKLTWTIENYDGNEIGEYKAIGSFELPESVEQSVPAKELKVESKVRVARKVIESELEFDENTGTITGYSGDGGDVVIPREINETEVRKISNSAFENKGLKSVNIPDTVTIIGSSAFADNQLTEVRIPRNVAIIGNNTFSNNELTEINIPNHVIGIENSAFKDNNLTKVNISDSVKNIGANAFSNNELTEVDIPSSVERIEKSAFMNNKLTKVNIPDSVKYIGANAFSDNELTEVYISKSVNEINSYAFYNNKLKTVDIPYGVKYIGANAFSKNELTEINIPDSVTTLENGAFSNNELEKVKISENMNQIGSNVFSNNKLTEINIPSNTTSIGAYAFKDNRIVEGKARINNYKNNVEMGNNAFANNGENGKTNINPAFLKDIARELEITSVEFLKDGKFIASGKISGNKITIQLPNYFSEDEIDKIGLGAYTLKIHATKGANVKQEDGAGGDWSKGIINIVEADNSTKFFVEKHGAEKEYVLTIKSPNGSEVPEQPENPEQPQIPEKEVEIEIPIDLKTEEKIKTETGEIKISPDTFDKNAGKIKLIAKEEDSAIEIKAVNEKEKPVEIKKALEIKVKFEGEVKNKDNVTAILIKEDGTKKPVGGVYDEKTKTIKFLTNECGKFIVEEGKKEFKDTSNVKWAKNEIESMAVKGIIEGKPGNVFDPNANISRAEFATLASRILKLNEKSNKQVPFKDVPKGTWYYKSVVAVYENGLVNGKSETTFDPTGEITREEIVKIIGAILKEKGYENKDMSKLNKFKDGDSVSSWAKEEAALVVENGIIAGNGKGEFAPRDKATRAETATMLYRLYDLILK